MEDKIPTKDKNIHVVLNRKVLLTKDNLIKRQWKKCCLWMQEMLFLRWG
jgi:hypothetical protein